MEEKNIDIVECKYQSKIQYIIGDIVKTYPDGSIFDGKFVAHGFGEYTSTTPFENPTPDNSNKYKGKWNNGNRLMMSVFPPDEDNKDKLCSGGFVKCIYSNGDIYEGNWMPLNGQYTYPNGDVYTGGFKNGNANKMGMFILKDGKIIARKWDDCDPQKVVNELKNKELYVHPEKIIPLILNNPHELSAVETETVDCKNGEIDYFTLNEISKNAEIRSMLDKWDPTFDRKKNENMEEENDDRSEENDDHSEECDGRSEECDGRSEEENEYDDLESANEGSYSNDKTTNETNIQDILLQISKSLSKPFNGKKKMIFFYYED